MGQKWWRDGGGVGSWECEGAGGEHGGGNGGVVGKELLLTLGVQGEGEIWVAVVDEGVHGSGVVEGHKAEHVQADQPGPLVFSE